MCRHATSIHKPKFACFNCRKSFRQTVQHEMRYRPQVDEDGYRIALCPQCGVGMTNVGLDFRVPRSWFRFQSSAQKR